MRTLVCLPTYNEEESIEIMISEARVLGLDILVTDGGSTDGTQEIVKRMNVELHLRPGKGKGYGIQCALELAHKRGYETLVVLDSDRTYPPSAIPQLLSHCAEHKLVMGSRKASDLEWKSKAARFVLGWWLFLFFWRKVQDCTSGMKAMNVNFFHQKVSTPGFEADMEIICRVLPIKRGIKEIPIEYRKRLGVSKVHPMVLLVAMWVVVKTRLGFERKRRAGHQKHNS